MRSQDSSVQDKELDSRSKEYLWFKPLMISMMASWQVGMCSKTCHYTEQWWSHFLSQSCYCKCRKRDWQNTNTYSVSKMSSISSHGHKLLWTIDGLKMLLWLQANIQLGSTATKHSLLDCWIIHLHGPASSALSIQQQSTPICTLYWLPCHASMIRKFDSTSTSWAVELSELSRHT